MHVVPPGNGNTTNGIGGVTFLAATVEFNTIADNLASDASRSGIDCGLGNGSNSPEPVRNNIIVGNSLAPKCAPEFSLFTTGTPGGTNRVGDPKFKDTNKLDPTNPSFYRIDATSAAIDGADPASTLAADIDGDLRPQGSGHDIGADELTP
jgi:hypothetical protein